MLIRAQTEYNIIRWFVSILRAPVVYSFTRDKSRPLIALLYAMKANTVSAVEDTA